MVLNKASTPPQQKSQKKTKKGCLPLYKCESPVFEKKGGVRFNMWQSQCLWIFLFMPMALYQLNVSCVLSWTSTMRFLKAVSKTDAHQKWYTTTRVKKGQARLSPGVSSCWRHVTESMSVQILVLRQWFRSSWRYFLHPARSTSHSYVLWCTSQQTFFVKTHEIQHPS